MKERGKIPKMERGNLHEWQSLYIYLVIGLLDWNIAIPMANLKKHGIQLQPDKVIGNLKLMCT